MMGEFNLGSCSLVTVARTAPQQSEEWTEARTGGAGALIVQGRVRQLHEHRRTVKGRHQRRAWPRTGVTHRLHPSVNYTSMLRCGLGCD